MKRIICIVLVSLIMTGCKTIEPQYYHGDHNIAIYQYFKGNEVTIEQQITQVLAIIEAAQQHGKPIAPGVHAHLGMLYFESGNSQLGKHHLTQEKTLFPESTLYIDYLLRTAQEV